MEQSTAMNLTAAGINLYLKIQQGGSTLDIIRVVVGSGELAENESAYDFTALKNEVESETAIIKNEVIGDGTTCLTVRILSGVEDYYLREIGIIADDPDVGEILYSYCNFGDYADYIRTLDGTVTTTHEMEIYTVIGNARDVTVNITDALSVTPQDFRKHTDNCDNPHGVTKEQLELGNVKNIEQASKAEFDAHTANTNNPHGVTKEQLELDNVINVKQASKAEFDTLSSKFDEKIYGYVFFDKDSDSGYYDIHQDPDNSLGIFLEGYDIIPGKWYGIYLLWIQDINTDANASYDSIRIEPASSLGEIFDCQTYSETTGNLMAFNAENYYLWFKISEDGNKAYIEVSETSIRPGDTQSIQSQLNSKLSSASIQEQLNNKVDKVSGKDLSSNDYTDGEKNKLAGIADNANNYTHPSSHAASIIEQDSTHQFVSDDEKSIWNNKASANYSSATIIVAASDTVLNGRNAHYICSANNAQTTIQTAINALPANGGKIVLLEGTYNISNEIALNKANITIEGMGRGATVLQTSGSNNIFSVTSSDCKISDMSIIQTNNSKPLGKGGIIISLSASRVTVRDVETSGFAYGISAGGSDTIIDSLYAHENAIGIYLTNGGSNSNGFRKIISNCLLMNNDSGIGIEGSYTNIFGNYIIDNNTGIWLTTYATPHYNKIHGNYIIRGTGKSTDYTSSQYTIQVSSIATYNDFSNNYILGKNYVNSGGSTNTFNNNRYE